MPVSLFWHEKVKDAFLPVLAERLLDKEWEMRADEEAKALIPDAKLRYRRLKGGISGRAI